MKRQPRIVPRAVCRTARIWKQRKREELRLVKQAWDRYWIGSAFTPDDGINREIAELLLQLSEKLSIKEWGR